MSNKCWHCGKEELVPDARGMRCASCGATDNKIPKLSNSPVDPGGHRVNVGNGSGIVRTHRVSKSLARESEEARSTHSG